MEYSGSSPLEGTLTKKKNKMVKNLNKKVTPSKDLLNIIDGSSVWEEFFAITPNKAIAWWWHGFALEGDMVRDGEAFFSIIETADGIAYFDGESFLGIQNEKTGNVTSRYNLVPNSYIARHIFEYIYTKAENKYAVVYPIDGIATKWGEDNKIITEETMTAIFYTLT